MICWNTTIGNSVLLYSNKRDVSGNVSTAKKPKSIVPSPQSQVLSPQSYFLPKSAGISPHSGVFHL